jgi:hypothetical protein
MNNKTIVIIGVGLIITIIVLGVILYPIFTSGTAKIRYVTNPSDSDGIIFGGKILIYIDGSPATNGKSTTSLPDSSKGIYPADQYITFSLATGNHKVEIRNPNWVGNTALASKTIEIQILTVTTVDLEYSG